MKSDYFIGLERYSDKSTVALPDVLDQLAFDERGLIPVITQDVSTKSVLMFAWMNKAALEQTLLTNRGTYWSRSRQELWHHCITVTCDQPLSLAYIDSRIMALNDNHDYMTKKFAELYGEQQRIRTLQ